MRVADFWKPQYRRRDFFDQIAQEFGFDPVIDYEKWYSLQLSDVCRKRKVSDVVLPAHCRCCYRRRFMSLLFFYYCLLLLL